MKVLFLHLSDLHYKNKDSFSGEKLSSMRKALINICKRENIDDVIIVFSGDLAMSGKELEYNGIKKIISKLIGTLTDYFGKNHHINILAVPGNHDIDFNNEFHSREKIRQIKSESMDDAKNSYLLKMSNFYNYNKINKLFEKNKIIDIKYIKINNFNIKVSLINSAPFSYYDLSEKPDSDSGLHCLSKKEMEILKGAQRGDLNICIMHHSLYYFEEDSRNMLNLFLKEDNDILFYGHEHINTDEMSTINGKTTKFLLGGPLSQDDGISIFNCVVYDTIDSEIVDFKYVWNNEQKVYEEESKNNGKINTFPSVFKSDYLKEISRDNLFDLDNFYDLFIFPELSYWDDENKIKIDSCESLTKIIDDNYFTIIEGDNNIGKTTLSKFLFLQFMNNSYPLLFSANSIKDVKISKIIKNVFDEQYERTKMSFSKFEQEDNVDKIAIIDDADKISDDQFDILLQEFKKIFTKVIVIKNTNSQYDLVSIAKRYTLEEEKSVRLKLNNIHYNKRLELLKKVCKYYNPSYDKQMIEQKANLINNMIINQINIFQLTPSFIIFFAKNILSNNYEHGAGKVFNAVFQSNITNMISKNSALDVPTTILLLQRIAYYIHKNREYPLTQKSFISIINEYNEECESYRTPINPSWFLDQLLFIRILQYVDNSGNIKFCYNSFLAYFVAKEALKQLEEEVITDIFEHMHYGINGDILLFMCYLDENKQANIIDFIITQSKKFFEKEIELDLDVVNVSYLDTKFKELNITLPNDKDKIDNRRLNDESEKKTKNDKLTVADIYDYEKNIDDLQKYVFTGMKFIELISKILPDFIHLLSRYECQVIVESIYTYPNKFLYHVLDAMNEKIQEINEEMLILDGKDNFTVEKEKISKFINYLQRLSLFLILNLYKNVARYATSNKTRKALSQFEFSKKTSYRLINSLIYDQLGETELLGEKLSLICDDTKNEMIKNFCKLIFHNHCLYTDIKYVGKTQSYVDKFLKVNKEKLIKLRTKQRK